MANKEGDKDMMNEAKGILDRAFFRASELELEAIMYVVLGV